jgi:PadR family transcriptional regulator
MKSRHPPDRGDQLPAFEQLVLLALMSVRGDDAYGMSIRKVLREHAGRDVSVPTVYSALDRLETRGFVTSWLGEATAERGGRAKRLYRVESAGVRALRDVQKTLKAMWQLGGLEQ